jgi:hypothetical protein
VTRSHVSASLLAPAVVWQTAADPILGVASASAAAAAEKVDVRGLAVGIATVPSKTAVRLRLGLFHQRPTWVVE